MRPTRRFDKRLGRRMRLLKLGLAAALVLASRHLPRSADEAQGATPAHEADRSLGARHVHPGLGLGSEDRGPAPAPALRNRVDKVRANG